MSTLSNKGNFTGAIPVKRAMPPALKSILELERFEQDTWNTAIPAWHPRNEETPEEKAAREKREKDAKDAKELGAAGQAALQRERDARKAAEDEAKREKKRADDLEREKLSDTEKLQKEAEDGRRASEAATATLRKANLLLALADKGLVGSKAKAAARLLDDVEYDASDEPKNLDARITAAKAEFGEDLFKGATPADKDDKKDPDKKDDKDPDTHAGPRPPQPDKDEDEQFEAYMQHNFGAVLNEPVSAGVES